MKSTIAKRLRMGPAAMTVDMHGRLQANVDIVFGTTKLSKQFKAAERLQSLLNPAREAKDAGAKTKA